MIPQKGDRKPRGMADLQRIMRIKHSSEILYVHLQDSHWIPDFYLL
jgi:hypothetical protein